MGRLVVWTHLNTAQTHQIPSDIGQLPIQYGISLLLIVSVGIKLAAIEVSVALGPVFMVVAFLQSCVWPAAFIPACCGCNGYGWVSVYITTWNSV